MIRELIQSLSIPLLSHCSHPRYFTYPEEPDIDYPDGFQGSRIPVHGPAVAKLIEDRLEGRL